MICGHFPLLFMGGIRYPLQLIGLKYGFINCSEGPSKKQETINYDYNKKITYFWRVSLGGSPPLNKVEMKRGYRQI